MTARKIILSGYYGFNNAGDEAVLAALVQILQENFADVEVVALSADPAATAQKLQIRAVNRWDKKAIAHELAAADLFCSGGGSLLQDVTSVRSVYYYTSLIRLAQRLGVPTMVLAQGLGPLNSPLGRWLVKSTLKKCKLLSWRDEQSQALAKTLGLGALPNYLVSDPVLLWEPECDTVQTAADGAIALAFRPWQGFSEAAAVELIKELRHSGERVVLVPLYCGSAAKPGEDEVLAEKINELLGDEKAEVALAKTPEEIRAVLASAKLVVGMRLHALIMAAAAGVPALAISYDPKVAAFAETMGIEEVAGGVSFEGRTAAKQVLAALSKPHEYPLLTERERWQPLLGEIALLLDK